MLQYLYPSKIQLTFYFYISHKLILLVILNMCFNVFILSISLKTVCNFAESSLSRLITPYLMSYYLNIFSLYQGINNFSRHALISPEKRLVSYKELNSIILKQLILYSTLFYQLNKYNKLVNILLVIYRAITWHVIKPRNAQDGKPQAQYKHLPQFP